MADVPVLIDGDAGDFDYFVVVDTASRSLLGMYSSLRIDVVVDHHSPTDDFPEAVRLIDESMTSCVELVLKLGFQPLDRNYALIALAGILYDTGHFRHATPNSLHTFADLMERFGIEMYEVYPIIAEESMDYGKRTAILKAMQRVRFKAAGRYVVAGSRVSSYEGVVARQLITAGAHVAFVASQKGERVRLSGRIVGELVSKGLHLGAILKELAEEFGCEAGGHDGAAGLTCVGDAEAILNAAIDKTVALLEKLGKD